MFKVSGSRSWLFGGFASLNSHTSVGLARFQVNACAVLWPHPPTGLWEGSFPTLFPGKTPGPAFRHPLALHLCRCDGLFSPGGRLCEAPGWPLK